LNSSPLLGPNIKFKKKLFIHISVFFLIFGKNKYFKITLKGTVLGRMCGVLIPFPHVTDSRFHKPFYFTLSIVSLPKTILVTPFIKFIFLKWCYFCSSSHRNFFRGCNKWQKVTWEVWLKDLSTVYCASPYDTTGTSQNFWGPLKNNK